MKRKYLIFNNSKIDFYVLQYTCGIWLRYFFPDQTTQIQIHIPRTARMESILHRCGASPFGVLASDAVVIVGGEPIPSGVLITYTFIHVNLFFKFVLYQLISSIQMHNRPHLYSPLLFKKVYGNC